MAFVRLVLRNASPTVEGASQPEASLSFALRQSRNSVGSRSRPFQWFERSIDTEQCDACILDIMRVGSQIGNTVTPDSRPVNARHHADETYRIREGVLVSGGSRFGTRLASYDSNSIASTWTYEEIFKRGLTRSRKAVFNIQPQQYRLVVDLISISE